MPGEEAWLVGEWRSSGERKYYLSNLPAGVSLRKLAAAIKARWVCEQAHQQMKEQLGLDHFEGRSWRGLHRHALMTMIAYAFLQHRRLMQAGGEKSFRKGPPQPTLPQVRHQGHHLTLFTPSDPQVLATALRRHAPDLVRLGLETGPLTPWLYHTLKELGLPIIGDLRLEQERRKIRGADRRTHLTDHLSTVLQHDFLGVPLQRMTEGVVRGQEEPRITASFHQRLAGAVGKQPCIARPVDGVGRAGLPGQIRCRRTGGEDNLVLVAADLTDRQGRSGI
jgi:hypothetical protein